MAPFDNSATIWVSTNTMILSPNQYNALLNFTNTGSPYKNNVYQLIPREKSPWSDLRERDRYFLARARGIEPKLMHTPTRDVRPVYVQTLKSKRSAWLGRWERSPLNKRALAKR